MSNYKSVKNDVIVDTQICRKDEPLRNSDKQNMRYESYTNCFCFEDISKWGGLWFRNVDTRKRILISSIKEGVVVINGVVGYEDYVFNFLEHLSKFFLPYSNFYGVKAIELVLSLLLPLWLRQYSIITIRKLNP